MQYAITHRTVYSYSADVSVSHHLAHLRPRDLPWQQVAEYSLTIETDAASAVERLDCYGNTVTFFTLSKPHRELPVVARSRVQVTAPPLPVAAQTPAWELVRELCSQDVLTPDSSAGEFCFDSHYIQRHPNYADYAAASFPAGRPLLEGIMDFTGRMFRDFRFDPRATTVATPLAEVFETRRGVCQDFAHFGVACLRSLGLPARYVSGYLETLPPPGRPRLVGADASHAWFSVWCPGHGWIDADPTNNLLPGERHITVAWGRDFGDVSPVRGVVVGGGEHTLDVGIDVVRVAEPTPTQDAEIF